MPGPTFLPGDGIDLHTVEEPDLEFLQEIINDPRVWRWLFTATPKRMADEEKWYESLNDDSETHLLVCDDGDAVGIVGLSAIDPSWGIAELGYFIDPDVHGQGYATEAVELLVDYAFDQRRLAKLYANVLAGNEGSWRVLEKNGFTEEGRFREQAFVDGDRVDVVRYGLLADDR